MNVRASSENHNVAWTYSMLRLNGLVGHVDGKKDPPDLTCRLCQLGVGAVGGPRVRAIRAFPLPRSAPREQGAEETVSAGTGRNSNAGAAEYAIPSGEGLYDWLRGTGNVNRMLTEVVFYSSALEYGGKNNQEHVVSFEFM